MGGRGQPPLASGDTNVSCVVTPMTRRGPPRGPLTVTCHYNDEIRRMICNVEVMSMICKSNNDYLHLQIH